MALFDSFHDHYPLDRPRLLIKQIERCGKKPSLPKYQTEDAAAMDIAAFLPEEGEITLQPGEWKLIPTGLCMAIPKGYGGFLLGRSGLAAKFGVSLTNSVGLIDADYRGEVKVNLINHGKEPFTVRDGDRIAQFLLMGTPKVELFLCDTLDETARGEGGFGSTGL